MRKGVIAKKAEGPRGPPSPSADGLPHVEAGEDSGQRLEPRKETTATKEGWWGEGRQRPGGYNSRSEWKQEAQK